MGDAERPDTGIRIKHGIDGERAKLHRIAERIDGNTHALRRAAGSTAAFIQCPPAGLPGACVEPCQCRTQRNAGRGLERRVGAWQSQRTGRTGAEKSGSDKITALHGDHPLTPVRGGYTPCRAMQK